MKMVRMKISCRSNNIPEIFILHFKKIVELETNVAHGRVLKWNDKIKMLESINLRRQGGAEMVD